MIINKLCLKKYGKFENKEFDFKPGINIFYGKNETGKSTISTALKTFFYTEFNGKQSFKKNYIPLSSDKGAYDVDFSTDNKNNYKSLVTLGKSNSKNLIKTINTDTGEELNGDFSKLGEYFFKVSEEMFDSVCYIKDLSSHDNLITYKNDVHDGLSKKESNLVDIDLSEVLGKIKDEIAEYKRPSPTGKIYPVEKKLEEIEKGLSEIEDIKESLEGIKEELSYLNEEEKSLSRELSDLIEKEECFKKYNEIKNAHFQHELREKIKKDEELSESLKDEFTPLKESELNILKSYEGSDKKEKNPVSSLVAGIIFILAGIGLLFLNPIMLLVSLIGIFPILNYFKLKKLNQNIKKEKQAYEEILALYKIRSLDHYLTLKEESFKKKNEIQLIKQRIEFNKEKLNDFNPEYAKLEIKKPEYSEEWVQEAIKKTRERLFEIKNSITEKKVKKENAFNNLPDSELLFEEKKELKEKLDALKKEMQIAEDCYKILNITNNSFKVSYIPYLNSEVAKILNVVLNGTIDYFNIKDDLSCEIRKKDSFDIIPKNNFSSGTIGLVYFAIRLAIYKMISKEEKIPLILDDCFLELDDERFLAIFNYLSENCTSQVFYFTSSERILNLTLANSTLNRL